jgi:hypothetical protein
MVLLVLNEKQKEKISLLNKFDETSKKITILKEENLILF